MSGTKNDREKLGYALTARKKGSGYENVEDVVSVLPLAFELNLLLRVEGRIYLAWVTPVCLKNSCM
jgi:hypothetical protein